MKKNVVFWVGVKNKKIFREVWWLGLDGYYQKVLGVLV